MIVQTQQQNAQLTSSLEAANAELESLRGIAASRVKELSDGLPEALTQQIADLPIDRQLAILDGMAQARTGQSAAAPPPPNDQSAPAPQPPTTVGTTETVQARTLRTLQEQVRTGQITHDQYMLGLSRLGADL